MIAAGYADGVVRLWDVSSWRPRLGESAKRFRDRAEWISDAAVVRADDDLLKRKPLAHTLAERLRRIRQAEPESSFLLHVDGPWGSGKTTLLNLLAEELKNDWLIIRYDAWRQARVGPPWWTLLVHLRHALVSSLPQRRSRWGLRIAETWERTRLAGAPYGLSLALVVAAAAGLFFLIRPDELSSGSAGDVARSATAVLTAIGTLVGGALALSRFLLWDSARGARVYEQVQTNPMEALADHFAWLIRRSGRPILFFIDDLDRCAESHVVELLDSIQTLVRDAPRRPERPTTPAPRASQAPKRRLALHHELWRLRLLVRAALRKLVGRSERSALLTPPPAPYFVVAADGAWVRQSYEHAHEAMGAAVAEPGRPLGYLFLTKIFQLTVAVPSLSSERQDTYLRALLNRRDRALEKPAVQVEFEALQDRVRTSRSEDEVVETLRSATPEVREALAGDAVEKLAEPEVERTTEHVLQKFAPLLEPDPRAMKRFVNAYEVERGVRTLEGNLVERDPLALWIILRSRWPGLAEYLFARPEAIEHVGKRRRLPAGTPPQITELIRSREVARVVGFADGGPLTRELVEACCGIAGDGEGR